ncbi:MAG: hypothetical protein IPK52_27165 [Chloroflexi bacterium]|nr:hypothetical protein [Chloroflexota bacterium]
METAGHNRGIRTGLAILIARHTQRSRSVTNHDYLLRGLIYVQLNDGKVQRLTGSTSNTGRSGGGTSYYCIESSAVNIRCNRVDPLIPGELMKIQVDPALIPRIQASYNEEVADKLGRMRPDQRADLKRKLKDIDEEEARALRLYASGKITDQVWDNLWTEWQDRRRTLRDTLQSFETSNAMHIANLDAAITVIAKVGVLYGKLERSNQRKLLREMVDRVVVTPEGAILRMELLPPFAYLKDVIDRVRDGSGIEAETKTSLSAGQCSSLLSLSDPNGTSGLKTVYERLVSAKRKVFVAIQLHFPIIADSNFRATQS